MKKAVNSYILSLFQDEGIRGREREERPADPRAGQKKQSMGREGKVHNHVEVHFLSASLFIPHCFCPVLASSADDLVLQP